MNLYTIVFVFVTLLVLAALAAFGYFIVKLDKWIDRKERLGVESIVKTKKTGKTIPQNKDDQTGENIN